MSRSPVCCQIYYPSLVVLLFCSWPYLTGASDTSPRNEIVYDHRLTKGEWQVVLSQGAYKLIASTESQVLVLSSSPRTLGIRNCSTCTISPYNHIMLAHALLTAGYPCVPMQASWYGQFSPNGTKVETNYTECSWDTPCLFDVVKDPTEHEDIAAANPDIVSKLKQV